jgi:DNA polymerase-4
MHRTILHIDADAFFASVEQGFIPLLRNQPVIVGGTEDQRGVVHTASYEARKLGVYTGMPLGHAKRLVPQAIFLKGNFEHYKAVSDIFKNIYDQFTPDIEQTSLDDAYLDLTATPELRRSSPEEIARQIQQQIYSAVHVTVSCGIGTSKLIARMASGMKKPNGLTCVNPGAELEFLHPLPVEELPGIGHVTKEHLHQLGITSIGQLAGLPKLLLIQLFGVNGQKFWELANGIDPAVVQQKIIPKQLSRETGFEEDISDIETVRAVLQYLTERIGKKLRELKLVGQTIAIKVDYSDGKRYVKSRSLSIASDCNETIFAMVDTLLDETPFRRLRMHRAGLVVSKITAKDYQRELFDDHRKREALEAAVDELRHRFGFTAVLPASLLKLQKYYRMEKSGYVLHAPALTQ